MIGIYSILNLQNNKRYIGYSIDIQRRWQTHKRDLKNNKHENEHLQNAYNLYGEENFVYEVIEECSIEEIKEREKYWIKYYNSKEDGYNMSEGGDGILNPTEDVRKKISEGLKGSKNGMYGVHLTGEKNGMYGKHHTEETRKILSEKAKLRTGKNSNRARKVQASTGEIFDTMIEAARWAGCKDGSSIGKACRGAAKTAGIHPTTKERLGWKYIDDDDDK